MKSILFITSFVLSFCVNIFAQTTTTEQNISLETAARASTDLLSKKYNLNEDQSKRMMTIQVRKLTNLSQIESLKTTDNTKYFQKLKNIQSGTLGSIRRLLVGNEQMAIYQKTQAELRTEKAKKRKQMTGKGLSKAEIEQALLDIYVE
jgi:hypothetical protein